MLVSFLSEDGEGPGPWHPAPGMDDDADEPTGPIILIGDQAVFTYVVTNPGDVQLANVVVTDDNATPDDLSDKVYPRVSARS